MVIDGLTGSWRGSSHLLRGEPGEEGASRKVPRSLPDRAGSHPEPGRLAAAPQHTREHPARTHVPTLTCTPGPGFLLSFFLFWLHHSAFGILGP